MLTRRGFLAAAAMPAFGTAAVSPVGTAAFAQSAIPKPVVAQLTKRRVPFGSASMIQTLRADPLYGEALVKHCDIIVPMNCLKWEQLRHDRNGYDTKDADEQIAFAQKHGKSVRGHVLAWGLALPNWAKTISTRAEAERELTNHIRTVVTKFRGRIPSWDVVNEAISDNPDKGSSYRDSIWLARLGPGYVDLAFKTAAEADPTAKLVLNDYNLENADDATRARRRALISLVKRLKDKGIPIHGVGFQSHLYAEKPIDRDGLARFVSDLDKLGMEILITELDVIDWRMPADIAARDMAAAKHVTSFLEAVGSAKLPSSIVTWGLSDKYSWVGETFKRDDRLAARPLPFDVAYKPKPMWRAIESFCAAKA